MTSLYHLIYSSKSVLGLTQEQLDELIKQARFKNFIYQVTGLLLYNDQLIVQVLEGTKENVMTVFDAISKDTRHHSLHICHQGIIEKRAFSNWNMGNISFSHCPEIIEKLAQQKTIDFEQSLLSNYNALSVVKAFSYSDLAGYIE